MMRIVRWTAVSLVVLVMAGVGVGQVVDGGGDGGQDALGTGEELIGEVNEGVRTQAVHLLELFYEDFLGDKVAVEAGEEGAMPFSTRLTCGECHDYEAIAGGWHFNSATGEDVAPGRVGEPWVYVDRETRTQVPVSGRAWPGVFRPEEVGLSAWGMVKQFGHHMPGGNWGELYPRSAEGADRYEVSGEWRIDCLTCHSGDFRYDASEGALQVARENFRWAAAAASGVASVTGLAMGLPASYDVFLGPMGGPAVGNPPETVYDEGRFNPDGKVYFDIRHKGTADRCYFCHSYQEFEGGEPVEEWTRDEDVHMAAGLTCADCHRNGQGHHIVRGYEGEAAHAAEGSEAEVASFSCKGCHLGAEWPEGDGEHVGRLGAPRPVHKGIPLVHFEELTCTACHSGPWPGAESGRVETARVHGLGLHGKHRLEVDLPLVASGVFAEMPDGRIAPARLIWPAYWGSMAGDEVRPLSPERVQAAAGDALRRESGEERVESREEKEVGDRFLPLSEEQIGEVLVALEAAGVERPVYVAGGRLYRLEGELLESQGHGAGRPYAWPIAHNVRPAEQSLGVKGCDDCHTSDNAFFFGKVAVDTPVAGPERSVEMYELQGRDGRYLWAFNTSFVFRPYLKATGLVAVGVILLVLLAYGLAGVRRVLARIGETHGRN